MSHSRGGELSAAVHDHLVRCTPVEGLIALADLVGSLLAIAPGPQRETARALFLELIDRAVIDRVIGEPKGRA